MTTGDYDPNAQPSGYPPPPPAQPYGPPGGYPPPPPPSPYGQQPGYPPAPGPFTGGQGADVWIRLGARLIDWIITGIAMALISIPFWSYGNYAYFAGVIWALLPFAYFVGFEVTQGWTPGKKLLGLQVRGPGGAAKPNLQQSAIRNSFMLLSIIPFYIGSLLALAAEIVIGVTINNSPTKQGKHDELAGGTQVIKG